MHEATSCDIYFIVSGMQSATRVIGKLHEWRSLSCDESLQLPPPPPNRSQLPFITWPIKGQGMAPVTAYNNRRSVGQISFVPYLQHAFATIVQDRNPCV